VVVVELVLLPGGDETKSAEARRGGDALLRADLAQADRKWSSDTLTIEQVVIFPKAKDRPVLLSALATDCEALLTLDRADFHESLGRQFYGMAIRTPGEWLMERRKAGEAMHDRLP
jgi:hypothetical protein